MSQRLQFTAWSPSHILDSLVRNHKIISSHLKILQSNKKIMAFIVFYLFLIAYDINLYPIKVGLHYSSVNFLSEKEIEK